MKLKPGMRLKENGSIEYRFVVDGKRYSVTAKSVRELQQKEQELRVKIATGEVKKGSNILFKDYAEKWIGEKSKTAKSGTIHAYSILIHKHTCQLSNKKLGDITKSDILDVLDQAKTASMYNNIYILLTNIFGDAVTDELIQYSPTRNVRMMKEKSDAAETIHRAFTLEEQEIIMRELKSSWYYELFALMLCTGMRCGEACALQWSDIDYKKNVIHVNKTAAFAVDGRRTVNSTKTEKSTRDIPMTGTIKAILEDQKRKTVEGNVFITPNFNLPVTAQVNMSLSGSIKKMNKHGYHIERFTTHAFRDTFATRFIEAGGSMQTLKTILGHASISMTMDLYAHVLPNTKQSEMNLLENML